MRVLLVEEESPERAFFREGLIREGFSVDIADTGKQALEFADERGYDAILLDALMPEAGRVHMLKTLRGRGCRAAIFVLGSQAHIPDRLEALNHGADDFLSRPVSLAELVARIRAVLRRMHPPFRSRRGDSRLVSGDLSLDLLKRRCRRGGRIIPLTKTEFDLLECFMRRPGQVISQSVLAQQVFNRNFTSKSNTVEVHIRNIRVKIDRRSSRSLIRTVRGCGYALDVE